MEVFVDITVRNRCGQQAQGFDQGYGMYWQLLTELVNDKAATSYERKQSLGYVFLLYQVQLDHL